MAIDFDADLPPSPPPAPPADTGGDPHVDGGGPASASGDDGGGGGAAPASSPAPLPDVFDDQYIPPGAYPSAVPPSTPPEPAVASGLAPDVDLDLGARAAPATPPEPAVASGLAPDVDVDLGQRGGPIGVSGLGVTVGGETAGVQGPKPLLGSFQVGAGRAIETGISVSNERVEVGPDGPTDYLSFQVTASAGFYEKAKRGAGPVGEEDKLTEGDQVTFELKIPTSVAGEVDRGERPFPNPWDPETLPVGSSAVFRAQVLTSEEGTVSYKPLTAPGASAGVFGAEKVTGTEGVAVGIERPTASTARIFAGSVEGVKNEMSGGLEVNLGPARIRAGESATHSMDDYELKMYELDLETDAGRRTYDQALDPRQGKLPDASPGPGVRLAEVTQVKASGDLSLFLEGKVDGAMGAPKGKVTASQNSADGTLREIRYADGQRVVEAKARFGNDEALQVKRVYQGDTEDPSQRKIAVAYRDLDGGNAASLAKAFGAGDGTAAVLGNGGAGQDAQLVLTGTQLEALEQRAADSPGSPLQPTLGQARTPEQALVALMPHHAGDVGGQLYGMVGLDQPLDGKVIFVDRQTGKRREVEWPQKAYPPPVRDDWKYRQPIRP
ncbi:MAG TPA: hypothetical protein VND93_12485 [Myxococcales bacterium]|nr:hypothetical protein [Myxococcales bacterium]